jgi:nitroreductase
MLHFIVPLRRKIVFLKTKVMNIDEISAHRRSYFPVQYTGEKVSKLTIERLLQNANWAPNHLHTEPWRFKVFEGDALKHLMDFMAGLYKKVSTPENFSQAKFDKYANNSAKASHIIAICMQRSDKPGLPETEEIAAVACAVQNMWLTLTVIPNTGGYWSSGGLVYKPEMAEFLKLETDQRCLGLFYIGIINPESPKPVGFRKPWEEKVDWVGE